ncbi:MAG: GNAT family N-acetyltransferase, partial [Betaproteobacteria bacterium]|nr:GNAT family N-acetyltransferase [Betaproteobacteria bacterium]
VASIDQSTCNLRLKVIRPSSKSDITPITLLLESSGHFDEEGVRFIEAKLVRHFETGDEGIWLTAEQDDTVVGVAHCDREALANGTWNLLTLWVRPDCKRQGHGTLLVRHLVEHLTMKDARLLLVETSGLESFAEARSFYARVGFRQEAEIQDFFADGDAKVIFTMAMPISTKASAS